ncbi:hypothetical protein ALMP_71640 [Streptomyces sp. A012304]|nr:hypothetical protein ALMP_71640 [Streptomyces sp. A012304]
MRKNTKLATASTLAAVALFAGSASAANAFDGESSNDTPIVINNENHNANTSNNTNTSTISDLINIGL